MLGLANVPDSFTAVQQWRNLLSTLQVRVNEFNSVFSEGSLPLVRFTLLDSSSFLLEHASATAVGDYDKQLNLVNVTVRSSQGRACNERFSFKAADRFFSCEQHGSPISVESVAELVLDRLLYPISKWAN